MIGAIIGDVVGSPFEFANVKTKHFPLLSPQSGCTDDSLMTIAMAWALLEWPLAQFGQAAAEAMRRVGRMYPNPKGGYGARFQTWLNSPSPAPYGSYGNGAAMRVAPCAEAAASLEEALDLARQSAQVTHDHPEGIKGAQAVAAAVYLARAGAGKEEIRRYIGEKFYSLDRTLDQIRPDYTFDESCQGTVPQAITAFFESESFEDALRAAVSLGGDSDTLAAITGSIAWPFYARGGPDASMDALRRQVIPLIPPDLLPVVEKWEHRCAASTP